ncbi:Benzoate-CoA ligase [Labilithrix luteola]|uniref:Benzoate-CoA ligase n=1 Tax=Labilithrix luteola TaxID=1391654 RepID=A0A0K1QH20_9BACT|nr:benzoate-CoA ligase family protein [Labilithrix luteola]AKV04720.1 Benzoate-CoA ligase [Labilithrix luteola]
MISLPDDLSLARYFLYDRLEEGLGSKAAVLFGERRWTYDEVASKSRRMAGLFAAHGIRRGERVLIVLPDAPPFAWTFFGVLTRGAVVAMGNPNAPEENLAYLVAYTRATAIVTVPEVAEKLRPIVERHDSEVLAMFVVPDVATGDDPEKPVPMAFGGKVIELAPALAKAPEAPVTKVHRDEPAIWLFTSGSTGEPKANVHTGRDFAFNTEVYAKKTVGYRESDVTVSVPRLFFGYATGTNLMFPFAVGATAGLFSERPTPESLANAIAMYKPTVVTNVPTMLGKLLEYDAELEAAGKPRLNLSSIRFSLSAGEALPGPLLARWQARFASDVYDGIGSAEMFHIYASNRPGDVKIGSLGKVVEGYELRVLPEEAEGAGATPCAPGEIGVLWVKGDSVSQGYWLDRDKSFRTFHGHWCRTGDLFHMDAQGYLYFAGRADDLLKVGGQWVAPLEVEECMLEHGAVAAVAVIGIEDEGLTKTKAFVVLRAGHAAHPDLAVQLQEHVRTTLAKYKYPRVVEFVEDLPKNDRGKVDKKALRAQHARVGS